MANFEQEIRDAQVKAKTGSARRFQAIDGVGQKTAEKLKSVQGVRAPTDAADFTADELAEAAGISESRAETVIRGGGGRPDFAEGSRQSNRSVGAGGLADALDERTQEAGEVVEQRRDVFENVIEIGREVPDRRQRRRGEFGPLDEADPEEVRELGRAAETFREATNDPIDPTAERQTFGFDVDEAREQAAQVAMGAQRFLEQERGLEMDEARSRVESGAPDVTTVEQASSSLLGGPRRSPDSGFFTAAPTQPTDIGREADGEFARPESSPDIAPAPIDRDRKTGEFGIDPFDMTAGGGVLDSAENLFGGDG